MSLGPGTRLGPYEITTPLGAGGMGEVYRAHDSRLRRDVAIKVIAARFAADPDLLKRFEQEALASAALNHPNIVAVYDVGSHDESPYLVTELLEGESLRRRLSRGALPVRTVVQFGLELVRGATAAHEKGIVHRDLKPENLFVTKDERLKILDFGLAKLAERALPADAFASQLTTAAVTELGTVLGTAGYMAPEQVRGETADHRADIFAIGAILYEMLTGQRAFHRETSAETLTAILREAPPDTLEANRRVPPALVRLVGHCLEKKAEDRFQSGRDLAFALESIDALSTDTGVLARSSPWASRPAWRSAAAVAAVAALAAGAFVSWRFLSAPALPTAEVRVHRLTDSRGLEEFPAISPDGKSVAFVAQAGGHAQIYVRLVVGGASLQITHDAVDHLNPRWSADSASIVYYQPAPEGGSDGAIWEIPALGGAPRRIATSAGGADVSHDGKRLVFPRFANGRMELVISPRDGTDPTTLAQLESGYQYVTPRWSFDDRLVAYQRGTASSFDIFVVSADGGESRQLTQHGARLEGLTWAPDRPRIIFASSRGSTIWYLPRTNLWAVDADGSGLRQLLHFSDYPIGTHLRKVPVAGGSPVVVRSDRASRVAISPDGGSLYYAIELPVVTGGSDLEIRVARPEDALSRVLAKIPARRAAPWGGFQLVISPDGKWLALALLDGVTSNLWALSTSTGQLKQLTDFGDEPIFITRRVSWSRGPRTAALSSLRSAGAIATS